MAQNHGFRARPWANLPLPNRPWAPLTAIAAVLATVALVTHGPRLGGDAPAVPDGRAYTTADAAPDDEIDRAEPDDPEDGPAITDHEATPSTRSTPRIRRRAPAASHRRRRPAPARPRATSPRSRRPVPTPSPPGVARPTPVPEAQRATPAIRRPPTPHRAPVSSAEREFGP